MSGRDLPQFISDGTFSWGALDYHFRGDPLAGLDPQAALGSADPWIVLAATLERAKQGDHQPVGQLTRLVGLENQNPLVTNIALEIIGTAGTPDQLRQLGTIIREREDFLSAEACGGASLAGTLTMIPAMLAAWTRTKSFRHRETIGLRLGLLLEEWDGPITTMEPLLEDPDDESEDQEPGDQEPGDEGPEGELSSAEADYVEIVKQATAELRSRCARDDSPVILGQPFGVLSLAKYMLDLTKSDIDRSTLGSMFLFLRHRFDASTGLDCSAFFKDRQFQPLSAAAILEEFLEGSAAALYEPETRYFFGHKIPD